MKFRVISLLLVIVFSFSTTGFVCATRVEKMEADIESLQIQFNDVQKRLNNDQTQLTSMILRADKKLEELSGNQNQSQSQVAQQNVQLALDLEAERAELASMRGRLEVQQKTIEQLQESLQAVMGSVALSGGGNAVILPSDQDGLNDYIQQKRMAGESAALQAALAEYLSRYPNDSRTESYLAELIALTASAKQDRDTITYCTQYLQKFPKGASRSDVLYQMGNAGLSIGNCNLAIQSFETLKSLNYSNADALLSNAKSTCKQ